MAVKESIDALRKNWRAWGAVAATGGAFAMSMAGCGDGEEKKSTSSVTPAPAELTQTVTLPRTTTAREAGRVTLTFDDLGGGSPIIKVYPGVTDTAADMKGNGTFNDGDRVVAECRTEGRTLHSSPNLGEIARESDYWVRIEGTPGEIQFATTVYAEEPEELLRQLEPCRAPSRGRG